MESFEALLGRVRDLDEGKLAESIERIGFECTRCGACCKGYETDDGRNESHTATVFPDEVRRLQASTRYDWRDIARPMPYGVSKTDEGESGETFEWALQINACGDCTFYADDSDEGGRCTVYDDRPMICHTYPFSLAIDGSSQPHEAVLERDGLVMAHECEGLGRDIDRTEARSLALALKDRTIRELEEAIAVRNRYKPMDAIDGVIVHDSEGQKRPDGRTVSTDS